MRIWLFIFTIALFPAISFANGPLRSIIIFGNEKTEQRTILDIINVSPQTYVNDQLVQEVDDRLNHSGLFKNVKITKERNPDGTSDLRVWVTEKQLWFAFPVFQAWSGRYSGGGVFGESNLFIPSASTLFLIQGGNSLNRVFAAVDAKNIFNSSFAVRTWAMGRDDEVPLYKGKDKDDAIGMRDATLSFTPGYQWTNDIETSATFNYSRIKYGHTQHTVVFPAAGTDGNDVSIEFKFKYDTLRRREALVKGQRLIASYKFADSRFGSDFTYHSEDVSWQNALSIWNYLNYVTYIHGEIADQNIPFHRELTLGGDSLRGYSDRQFRGDTMIQVKQDMLFRILKQKHFSIFGTIFYDMGLLYREPSGISRKSFRNGTGGGLRISLADILAPVFGFDAAYGIEDKDFNLYFAVGLVEF